MQINTPGLRVLVTAGASGIGRSIAESFLSCGARVHICDIDDAALAKTAADNPGLETSHADVSKTEDVDRLLETVTRQLGGLDVLVNNAGIAGPVGAVESLSTDDWERTIAVNITGMFYCTRRFVPLIKAAGGGSIINMSSAAGRLPYAWRTPYSASKWAVIGFTISLALELGPDNIRANALLPGFVEGERHDRNARNRAAVLGIPVEELEELNRSRVAMHRFIEPQEVAGMAVFLASDLGRSISGQTIGVCGYVQSFGS